MLAFPHLDRVLQFNFDVSMCREPFVRKLSVSGRLSVFPLTAKRQSWRTLGTGTLVTVTATTVVLGS